LSVQPVSDGQRALWLLHRRDPERIGPAYTIAAAGRIRGAFDPRALEGALETLVRRHPALRTSFPSAPPAGAAAGTRGEGPVQRVAPPSADGSGILERLDGRSWPAAEVPDRLADLAYRPFDVEAGPLVRAALVERPDEAILVLALHHLVGDLWSLAVLVRELGRAYGSLAAGRDGASDLEPLHLTHGAWAARRRQVLDGAEGERLWAFWRQHLASGAPPLELPTGRPRPPVQSFAGGVVARALDPAEPVDQTDPIGLRRELGRLARRCGTNRFTALLAAYQVVLGRWSGQDDFLVGTPTAGRGDVRSGASDLAGVVGYFVNPVPVRAPLAGDPTFRELLERLGEETAAVLAHQDLPFPLLAEHALDAGIAARDPGRSPLFQALFVLQKSPIPGLRGLGAFALGREGAPLHLGPEDGGLTLSSVPLPQRGAQFDLALYVTDEGGALVGSVEYCSALFDRATAERFLGHLAILLRGAVEAPERRLSELPLLTGEERRQVLGAWTRGGRGEEAEEVPAGAPAPLLHDRFLALAAAAPEAEALLWADGGEDGAPSLRSVGRGELDRRSSRVAAGLRALGVGPEVPVGVFLERTPELVIALLGVLRAGGAYVPMDPAYPRERLALMIEDSRMPLVIAGEGLGARLPAGTRTLGLAALEAAEPGRPDARPELGPESGPELGPDPESLAYVIYTSGSTGRPKGVAITHRSASALVDWAESAFEPAELAGVLAATSVCFDLSVFELFVPLSLGGRIVLAANALALGAHPAAERVTLVNTVPSAMEGLCAQGELPPSVRTVCLAGEPLRRRLVDAVYEAGRVERVHNLYGPSEDTTYSTGVLCPRDERAEPTIGTVLAGGRSCVTDVTLRPVAAGVPGELLLGGVGLARGYLGRPGLTAERFVPDPFGPPGGRLYRTGDRVRWLPDGALEFLGRLDHQVKVRGFRIELGEVEVALESHPAVAEAVAVVRGEGGERRLVGYVKAATGEMPEGGALRSFLAGSLPGYMVPDALVVLEDLPRTPNGKVDRRALPAPAGDRSGVSGEYVEPETEVELLLAGLWQEVLGVDRVGIHDSFFELGGHSLSAHRLLLEVRETFGVEVPVHRLFERPTVAGLATAIAEALMAEADEETLAEVFGSLEG